MRYLAEHYPEWAASGELHPHQDAAHDAAVAEDQEKYLEALRDFVRTGRRVALEARGRVA